MRRPKSIPTSYRIPIPLTDEAREALFALAQARGGSVGGVAGQVLHEAAERLQELARVTEATKADQGTGKAVARRGRRGAGRPGRVPGDVLDVMAGME